MRPTIPGLLSAPSRTAAALLAALLASCCAPAALAQLVPGTGQHLPQVGDDFEDPQWSYVFNLPKSSEENDGQTRQPGGYSTNGRWFEGIKRGQPDRIERVAPPPGGLEGSTGALLLGTRQSGIPGRYTGKFEQDDFICNVSSRLKTGIPISRLPSVVVRVHVPPFEHWERRYGPSFGFRTSCFTHKYDDGRGNNKKKGRHGGSFFNIAQRLVPETYWPGMFIHFVPGDGKQKADSAYMSIRAGSYGQDLRGPAITPGWWTLGMSFTRDGRVHYYAKQGVEDLTAEDHITSQSPYSYRCERMDTMFFNVVSGNNGQWSTPWIIDDAQVFIAN